MLFRSTRPEFAGETDDEEEPDEEDEDDIVIPIHGSRQATGDKAPGLGKFRTAADVLNRLRWDSTFDSADFVVGYEDRFLGARERAVDQWKSEQTDEEFIPQHRILYFKRKSDEMIMWERRSRVDKVFGSGI